MAEIQPLRALHYNLPAVGALEDVVAPPYDVIDPELRAALAARSPYNVVSVDLPEAPGAPGDDAYAAAGRRFLDWQRAGVLERDAEPAVWAHTQRYSGPDGVERTRSGFFCRVRIEDYATGGIRPHERTHPGPKQDRLRLTRATATNLSPIFSLYSDPDREARDALAPFIATEPTGQARDAENTVHRIWRVRDPQAIATLQRVTARSELLIADGHHRYETAQAYAREIDAAGAPGADDGETAPGAHDYVLMCLVALEDPGLTVFPTHRLLGGLDEARWAALDRLLERDFDVSEVAVEDLAPPPTEGAPDSFEVGLMDRRRGSALRLALRDQGTADRLLSGRSDAYRHLDTGILEALILKDALGLGDEDISHLNGFGYARDPAEARRALDSGAYDVAFIMRPTPVAQVRALAAAGENMPPKSTYFFPKLLTGLLFNPLQS